MINIDPSKIYSTGEIANILNTTARSVARWCKSGKLPSQRLGREYMILGADLIAFIESRK